MNVHDALRFLASRGLALAEYVYRHGADGLGLDGTEVRLYSAIGACFYGSCSEKPIRSQVLEESQNFPIARLAIIHKAANQLHAKAPMTRWQLRLELSQLQDLNLDELRQHAKARVRELNVQGGSRPVRSLIIGRQADATGRRTAVLKLPEQEMAQFESSLRTMIRNRGQVPEDIAMGNACWTIFNSGRGLGKQHWEPTVLVTAEDLAGVGNSMLQATDGTLIDAAEYLDNQLTDHGWALMYDCQAKPVNLWRIRRTANAHQRAIIAADQGQCAWPGCSRVALYGAIHHLEAWSQGGNTNLDNLIGLCGPHNAMNDDDPTQPPKNGRMSRDSTGRPVWIPPDGSQPIANNGHHTSRSGRAYALKQLGFAPKPE